MSSKFVRDNILSLLQTEAPTESIIDLTADFLDLSDLLQEEGLTSGDPWLGLQFVGGEEVPMSVEASNQRGKYREHGVIFLHVVELASLGVHNVILNRAEALRDKLRGRRIGNSILIESVSPVNFGKGSTLSFDGGYTAGVIQVDYQRDLDL